MSANGRNTRNDVRGRSHDRRAPLALRRRARAGPAPGVGQQAALRQPGAAPARRHRAAVPWPAAGPARRHAPAQRPGRTPLPHRRQPGLRRELHRRRLGHARPRHPAGAAQPQRGGLGRRLFRQPVAPLAAPHAAPAAAEHARRQPAQHLCPLRPRQRVLRRLARSDHDLLLGAVCRRRGRSRGGAAGQVPQPRPGDRRRRRPEGARDRQRLGRLRGHRRQGVRRQGHLDHGLARPGRVRPRPRLSRRARRAGRDPAAGLSRREGPLRPHRLDRDVRGRGRALLAHLLPARCASGCCPTVRPACS